MLPLSTSSASPFQGKQLSEDGEVVLDGWSGEPCRFYCPRDDPFDANVKTDLFALGCTIYFIMMGHAVFPDIIDGGDGWHEQVEQRFVSRQFPRDQHACSAVTLKCWQKEYESVTEIVRDITALESSWFSAGEEGRGRDEAAGEGHLFSNI
jgi:hypothetical protein